MREQRGNAAHIGSYEERIRRNRARRNRELRRRLSAGILALTASLFVLLFAFNGLMTDAKEEGGASCKYYRSVAILPRDTVETLADTCLSDSERALIGDPAAYAREIRSINHLESGEEPPAGTKLIIPYYSPVYAE